MESLIVGLASLVAGVSIQRAFLGNLGSKLRAREQAFQFHALRDELQLLIAEGRMSTSSLTHDFLMKFLNFCIRNAGALKLREILEMAERVKNTPGKNQFSRVMEDIQKHDSEVQQLAQKFFFALANMLVSNDWLVRGGVETAKAIATSWRAIKPFIQILQSGMSTFLGIFMPTKVKAVRQAQWYFDQANRLNPCS